MARLLSEAALAARLAGLEGWSLQDRTIRRTFQLGTFPAAIGFVTRVAFAAEAAGHHPDIDIRYSRVTLALTTHDAGGLTEQDFALASQINALLAEPV